MHAIQFPAMRMTLRAGYWLGLAAVVLALAACESGDRSLNEVDPAAVSADPTYDQVFAIIHRECLMCHDSSDNDDDDDDDDGPYSTMRLEDDIDLSTCTAIVAQRWSIRDQVEANTMPPGAMPRLTSEEKLIIRRWIDDGAPAPCN
jgi:uncharacterized membrane protein